MPKTEFLGIKGEEKVSDWIKNGLNQESIKYAESFGQHLSRDLTTNQIRNVFGEVKRIQMKGKDKFEKADLLLLKPKLSYAKARKVGVGQYAAEAADSLRIVLSKGIDAVFDDAKGNEYERFVNFSKFFEAILAYHKSYGGK